MACSGFGYILGPIIYSVLFTTFGFPVTMYIQAIQMCFVGAAFILFVPEDDGSPTAATTGGTGEKVSSEGMMSGYSQE